MAFISDILRPASRSSNLETDVPDPVLDDDNDSVNVGNESGSDHLHDHYCLHHIHQMIFSVTHQHLETILVEKDLNDINHFVNASTKGMKSLFA